MIEERKSGLFLKNKYWSYLAQVGIVAVIYFGIAKLSLALTGHPSPVSPQAGFALAVILLFGYRLWPGMAMGTFMEVILEGLPIPIAFATAAGSAAGALAGAYLFNRLGFRNSMERPMDVLGLVVLGCAVSPTIGATSGALSFYLSGIIPWAASGSFWMTWWLGNMLGVIVVAPLVLVWSKRPRFDLKSKQVPEVLALLALLVLVSDFIFSRPVAYIGYEYMLFPFLIWAALRFGQKGATTAIIILSGIAIWHTSHGYGPFVVGTPAENLIILQIFNSIVALTIMTLAAIVTERNLIEDTLRKEKTFTEDALNLLEDVFFVLDVNGRFLRWNTALRAITGYSDKEISTKKPGDFFLGEDIRNISNAIEMVMKNGTAKVEAEIVTKNGEHINYEFTGTMLRDSNGKPLGICGAGRNITELKRAALEYKAILQTAMDGFYRVDTQGRILDVNDSYCSLIGYSREELLNMSLKDIDVLDTEEDIAQRIKRVMENGWDRFETRHKCKDGRIVEIEASVNYDKAGGGKFFAFMRDITKSNQVQKAYKESEARLSEAQAVTHIGNWEWKLKTNELYWSPESHKIFGLSPTISPSFQDFLNIVHPDDLEFVKKSIDESFHGKNYDLDIRIIKPDGSDGYVHAMGIVIFDEEGNPTRMFGTVQDITKRKLTEYELSKFKLGIERSNEAIFITDIDGTITYINSSFENLYGFNSKETLGKTPRILKSGLLPSESYKPFWDTLLSKNIVNGELINKTKDGRLLNIMGSANPILNDKGNIIGFLAIQRDITERKKVEAALQESKNIVDAVLENVPLMIFLKEAEDLRFVILNRAGEELLGYDRKYLIGKNNLDLFPPEQSANFMAKDREVLDGELNLLDIPQEPIMTAKKGERLIHTRKVCIRGADGVTKYLLGISEDITESKMAEKNLRESEERFRSITQSANDAIIILDTKGDILFWNNGAQILFGYRDEDVTGKHLTFLIPERYRDAHQKGMERLLVTGVPHIIGKTIELSGMRKDGSEVMIELSLATWKTGDRVFYSGILRDITGRKQAEKQIQASLNEKEILLREIHHRVKNNMQIVSSLLKFQAGYIEDKKHLEMFKESQNRIMAMSLVHEKLYKSKDFTKINFKDYIHNLANGVFQSYSGRSNNILLNLNIENVELGIDSAIHCGLIINELVTNSIKHAFPDEKKGEIKIVLGKIDENEYELTVSDNGIGIPEDVDFRKTETLGLHLVSMLAEDQLSGKINLIRSKGTEFSIRFGEQK